MGAYYDEVEIEDMVWDEDNRVYHYPCPCGDRFEISREQLKAYEDIATCPSCSLVIRVVFDPLDYQDDEEDEDDEASGVESSEDGEDDEEADDHHSEVSGSEEDSKKFQGAFENLHISEHPGTVVVSAFCLASFRGAHPKMGALMAMLDC